jgi:ABC-type uncharacterized transport system substrate-binding protein
MEPVILLLLGRGLLLTEAEQRQVVDMPFPPDHARVVADQLVINAARPGGNLTGVNFFNAELVPKQLELLHELVPRAARVAVFVNPANVTNAESVERDAVPAARSMGLQIQLLQASTSQEIDSAFANICARTSAARKRSSSCSISL